MIAATRGGRRPKGGRIKVKLNLEYISQMDASDYDDI